MHTLLHLRFPTALVVLLSSFLAYSPVQAVEVESTQTTLTEVPFRAEGAVVAFPSGDPVVMGGQFEGNWIEGGVFFQSRANTWEVFTFPVSLRDAATVSARNEAWIVGGRTPDGWSRMVWRLTPGPDGAPDFTPIPELPEALSYPAVAIYSGFLYVAGVIMETPGAPAQNALFRMPVANPTAGWQRQPVWSEALLHQPVFGVQNSELFLSGQPDEGVFSPVYRLKDVRHTEWDRRMDAPVLVTRSNAVSTGHSSLLFLVETGTDDISSGSHRLVSYNVITNRWAPAGTVDGHFRHAVLDGTGRDKTILGLNTEETGLFVSVSVGMASMPFGWIDYSIIFVYIIGLVLMGFYFSRREKGTDDYFVGGRKVPWWAVGLSLYATGTSAISFMAISGRTYSSDWLYFTSVFFGLMLAALIALILVPLIRKLNITSTYEYLEMRFHVSVRLTGSMICILTQLGSRMAVVLFLPALALSKVTGISVVESVVAMGVIATLYTYLGGIKAVIWTDVVQVILLLGGAFFCLGYVLMKVDGGVAGFFAVANEYDKLRIFDWRLTLESATIWVFFLASAAGIMTIPNDQVMMQRVLSTKNEKAATNSIWTLTLMTIPGNLVFFSLGTALWVFYANFPTRMDPSLQFDATFPHFVAHEFPIGLAGLVISALFAASMSTLDSGMNSVSTIITVDFYKRFKKKATDKQCLRLARNVTLLAGFFSTIMALMLTRFSLPSLWDTMILLTGLIGGGFGGVFALGMLTRRSNAIGALTGVAASLVAALLVRQYGNVHVFMVMPTAVFTVVIVGYLVSLITPYHGKDLRGLTLFKQDRMPRTELQETIEQRENPDVN